MQRRFTMEELLWALLEVKNDGVYAKRLKELEDKTNELNALTGVVKTVEAADALMSRAKKAMEDAVAQKADNEAELAKAKAEMDAQYNKLKKDEALRNEELRMNWLNAGDLLEQAQAIRERNQEEFQRLAKLKAHLDEKVEYLRKKEEELEGKAQQLKAILGG